MTLSDHPLRYALANELHARPFPALGAPGRAAYLAMTPVGPRNREAERAHFVALLDRYGAPHPQPDATHYFGQIGRSFLKWESHSEFVTYTILEESAEGAAFDPNGFDLFPADWLAQAPGQRITSALLQVSVPESDEAIVPQLERWFEREGLSVARVLDDDLVVASDFRFDPAGHMRFALFARPETGRQRIGRVVQRLCEIETYKAMSMLGLVHARELMPDLARIDGQLAQLTTAMEATDASAEDTLGDLLGVAAQLEDISARSSYRFGATKAYEKIVNQRIEVLRERRFGGRQTFGEFMMRRYDPAMRTVQATEARIASMAARAARASDLLRTRVDVERSAENQAVLASLDQRADLQLRLQQTVEGLSVVAISYYGVSLVGYALAPLAKRAGLGKTELLALATPVVLAGVWWMIRRIHKSMH